MQHVGHKSQSLTVMAGIGQYQGYSLQWQVNTGSGIVLDTEQEKTGDRQDSKPYKFHVHQCQAQIEIWRSQDPYLT